ncbi:MAG: hypothetical protein PUI23_07195, partial [Bacteroidales bacterium]|nr:hypothetical protein [Bacteroidales bacterium]MDY5225943.1 hypothetical protein [Sodaliphilus sp.]
CMRVMLFFFKVSNFIALTKIFVKFFEVNESTSQRGNESTSGVGAFGFLDFSIFRGLEDTKIRDFEKSIYWLQKIGVNRIKMD